MKRYEVAQNQETGSQIATSGRCDLRFVKSQQCRVVALSIDWKRNQKHSIFYFFLMQHKGENECKWREVFFLCCTRQMNINGGIRIANEMK